ncbi:leucine-rich_repeat domain-containing protein [Hexamita inflata]|uniref:Leucine-rich repeat domain-containing protein n=1 Tax=Hexamita inflata TaxID=28002 RepID=A0AA86RA84_9EUKA|nr:leucine-rich repeat domain-containing protein [Hexamita inflata]
MNNRYNLNSESRSETSKIKKYEINETLEQKYANKVINGCLTIDDDIQVQSLKFLDFIPEVTQITVKNCKNISFAQVPLQITNLKICNCGLSHISGINQIKNLQQVHLSDNTLIFDSIFQNLSELKSLHQENNKFTVQCVIKPIDLFFAKYSIKSQEFENYDLIMVSKYKQHRDPLFGKLRKIQDTELTSFKFADELVTPLKNGKLQLILSSCWNVNFVKTPIKVNDLNFTYCGLQNINGIQQMNLVALDLRHNYLIDIEPLREMKTLKQLNLASNMIIFIDALRDLTQLTEVNLDRNKIQDFKPIQHHKKFAKYTMNWQEIPTQANICHSLKLKNVREQFEAVYNIKVQNKRTNKQFIKTKEQVTKLNSSLYFNQIQSTNKIAQLFQQLQRDLCYE